MTPRAQATLRTMWILPRTIGDKMSVSAVAAADGPGWNTLNTLALDAARPLVAAPALLEVCGSGSRRAQMETCSAKG